MATLVWFLSHKKISIRKENGRGLCDIAVDRRIGIELKKDFKEKKQINRLIGQIVDYKREYEDLIIVFVGNTDKNALDILRDAISDLSGNQLIVGLSREPRIKIIDKGVGNKKKQGRKSSIGLDFGNFSW